MTGAEKLIPFEAPTSGDFKQLDLLNAQRHEMAMIATVVQEHLLSARVQYPETKFRHYFAPFFLGFQPIPKDQNIYAAWQAEVGSLSMEVDVVDETGQVVFVVPALLDTSAINLMEAVQRDPVRFNTIAHHAESEALNFPQIARTNYYNNLGNKLLNTFSANRHNADNLAKWLRIFEYYQVPTEELVRRAREVMGNEAVNSVHQHENSGVDQVFGDGQEY